MNEFLRIFRREPHIRLREHHVHVREQHAEKRPFLSHAPEQRGVLLRRVLREFPDGGAKPVPAWQGGPRLAP